MRRHSACLVPRFFTGERVGQRGFLQVLVTGTVTNRKQKIPSQITGKIMFKPIGHFYFCSLKIVFMSAAYLAYNFFQGGGTKF